MEIYYKYSSYLYFCSLFPLFLLLLLLFLLLFMITWRDLMIVSNFSKWCDTKSFFTLGGQTDSLQTNIVVAWFQKKPPISENVKLHGHYRTTSTTEQHSFIFWRSFRQRRHRHTEMSLNWPLHDNQSKLFVT